MPFDHGSFSMSIFSLKKDLPDNALELFEENKAGKLDDVTDEPQIGWVSGRHLLENRIDEETAFLGGHLFLNLRIAERKVPGTLLKAEARMEELAHIKETGKSYVPKKVKKEIKENILEKRLPQMVPSLSGIPVIIDQTDNTIYVGATSNKQIDTFLASFNETIPDTIPVQITAEELMEQEKLNFRNYDGISLSSTNNESKEDTYSFPGRDFLTWLWFFSEEETGSITSDNFGEFAVMLDGPLSFISSGEGAHETVVKRGNPLNSVEAQASLDVGKKLKKAKIILTREKETWSTNFDADNFTFSSVNLPEGEEMDYASRFAERVNNIHILKEVFMLLYKKFLNNFSYEQDNTLEKQMQNWIKSRKA